MVQELNKGILTSPLKIISGDKGKILHALKKSDEGFSGFGEAYFSTVDFRCFKGWKKHKEMVLNLVVPSGAIRFYIVDDRDTLFTQSIILSKENYLRLTIPPGVWLGFEGMDQGLNMLLNIASTPHEPSEAENKEPVFFAQLFPELSV
jgi:dTDP-4-dehydrorhamnose 3,5-epimerase